LISHNSCSIGRVTRDSTSLDVAPGIADHDIDHRHDNLGLLLARRDDTAKTPSRSEAITISGVSLELMNALAILPEMPIPRHMVILFVHFSGCRGFLFGDHAAVYGLVCPGYYNLVSGIETGEDFQDYFRVLAGADESIRDDPLCIYRIDARTAAPFRPIEETGTVSASRVPIGIITLA